MPPSEEMQQAQINRSIRTIKAELEYLCDASVISPQALSDLLSRVPAQTPIHAPISVGALPTAVPQNASTTGLQSPMGNLSVNNAPSSTPNSASTNEKQNTSWYQPNSTPQPAPAYNTPPPQANWAPLAQATALYAYTSTDAGDLELQPGDQIAVTEYMNAEWWKGKSSRSGQEGIFPRSYVKVTEERAAGQVQDINTGTYANTSNNYGNMPLDVSQMGNGTGKVPTKFVEQGKKFGKKLGNAAIFGAGMTIGSDVVNAIL